MSKIQSKSAFATFPMGKASSTGEGISNRLGVTGAGTSFAIPAFWKGRNLRVTALRADFKVSVTATAQVLVFAQSSPPDNAVATCGYPLLAGTTSPDGIVPMDAGFFNYVTDGTGDLFFTITEPESVLEDGPTKFP
jgi:hypothetical protein